MHPYKRDTHIQHRWFCLLADINVPSTVTLYSTFRVSYHECGDWSYKPSYKWLPMYIALQSIHSAPSHQTKRKDIANFVNTFNAVQATASPSMACVPRYCRIPGLSNQLNSHPWSFQSSRKSWFLVAIRRISALARLWRDIISSIPDIEQNSLSSKTVTGPKWDWLDCWPIVRLEAFVSAL